MSVLPLEYYKGFLTTLLARGDVEFITYNDLKWVKGDDYKHRYPAERKRWRAALRSGDIDKNKVYVLIQHDTDSAPGPSVEMAQLEASLNIRSSIMTFARWNKEARGTPIVDYEMDWPALQALEKQGFCIGYHTNAMQLADFDEARAIEEFKADERRLKQLFKLKFFSPHGGLKGPNGEMNCSVPYPEKCPTELLWVHNVCSVAMDTAYSDGALSTRIAQSFWKIDLRAWTSQLKAGQRARVLIHPQYYRDIGYKPLTGDTLSPWYREFVGLMDSHGPAEAARIFWATTGDAAAISGQAA